MRSTEAEMVTSGQGDSVYVGRHSAEPLVVAPLWAPVLLANAIILTLCPAMVTLILRNCLS